MAPTRPDLSLRPMIGPAGVFLSPLLRIWFAWVGWKLLRLGAQTDAPAS